MIEQVRRRKRTWVEHVSKIRNNRWTLRITTGKPNERKTHRGRPARQWKDELDDYWKGTHGTRRLHNDGDDAECWSGLIIMRGTKTNEEMEDGKQHIYLHLRHFLAAVNLVVSLTFPGVLNVPVDVSAHAR